jgi:hypothetical protein
VRASMGLIRLRNVGAGELLCILRVENSIVKPDTESLGTGLSSGFSVTLIIQQ